MTKDKGTQVLDASPENLARLAKIKHYFPDWTGKHLDWLIEIDESVAALDRCPIAALAGMLDDEKLKRGAVKQIAWAWVLDLRQDRKRKAEKRASYESPQLSMFHPEAFDSLSFGGDYD